MNSIELVSHVWSGDDVPVYHELLRLQLNSLVSDPPEGLRVFFHLCYSPRDRRTVEVIREASGPLSDAGIVLILTPLDERHLFRRAIGRNIAAKGTRAEAVWFTDCDHLFTAEALPAAYHETLMIPTGDLKQMRHPEYVNVHASHDLGDDLIRFASSIPWGGLRLDGELGDSFVPRRERKAIGGLQIVRGEWARERGYLDGTEWTEPVEAEYFQQCKCDVPYRKSCGGSRAVEIPGVFRARHTRAGRDRGTKDHGEKTRR